MARRKCAIVGCGNVGSCIAYTLITVYAGLFEEIILIDINKKRAMAEAEDISTVFPFMRRLRYTAAIMKTSLMLWSLL